MEEDEVSPGGCAVVDAGLCVPRFNEDGSLEAPIIDPEVIVDIYGLTYREILSLGSY
jgi:preprotein translocase subunit Sec61beta